LRLPFSGGLFEEENFKTWKFKSSAGKIKLRLENKKFGWKSIFSAGNLKVQPEN
jgi:hypothetical protein